MTHLVKIITYSVKEAVEVRLNDHKIIYVSHDVHGWEAMNEAKAAAYRLTMLLSAGLLEIEDD